MRLRQKLLIVKASTTDEIEAAFATLVQLQTGALVVGADAFFNSRREQLAGAGGTPRGSGDL